MKPGEPIGLDGEIVSSRSSVSQAPITGESLPVDKTEGDRVFAGTINESGSFDYRVTAAANNTTLARIIHAVEEAQGAKAPTQRFVDQFAHVYTPIVFVITLAVAILPPLLMSGRRWRKYVVMWSYRGFRLDQTVTPVREKFGGAKSGAKINIYENGLQAEICKSLILLVGMVGFELITPCAPYLIRHDVRFDNSGVWLWFLRRLADCHVSASGSRGAPTERIRRRADNLPCCDPRTEHQYS